MQRKSELDKLDNNIMIIFPGKHNQEHEIINPKLFNK